MLNVEKWPSKHTYGVHNARFLNHVWPFFNIMHDSFKDSGLQELHVTESLLL